MKRLGWRKRKAAKSTHVEKPPKSDLKVIKFLLGAMICGPALSGAILWGCQSLKKREWKKRTPVCEGPRIYKIAESKTVHTRAKKDEDVILGGKKYTVVGHISRSTDGELIVKGKESGSVVSIGPVDSRSFLHHYKFDGWTCEKPKTVKSD